MGTYATTTSLDTLMIGVTFDTATTSLVSTCIDWAESEVDKKLADRYDVSDFKTTVPPIIRSLTEQLGIGYTYQQMSRGSKESLTRAETMIKKSVDNLDQIASGKLQIVNTAGSLITPRSDIRGIKENTSDYHSTFAEDNPLDWTIDPDKLLDIESERD